MGLGAIPAGVSAAENGQWHVGLSGGTLGISPEVGYRFGERAGIRLNGGQLDYDRSEEIDDIDYDGTLELNSFGLMADWYPTGGSFRLSAGVRNNNNEIDLEAQPVSNIEIGDQIYTPAQVGTLRGKVKVKDFTPALTLGWGGELEQGFMIGFEAGVLLQGSPEVSLAATGGALANNPAFLDSLERERARAEEDAEDFELWPVLQLHFGWRF